MPPGFGNADISGRIRTCNYAPSLITGIDSEVPLLEQPIRSEDRYWVQRIPIWDRD